MARDGCPSLIRHRTPPGRSGISGAFSSVRYGPEELRDDAKTASESPR